MWKIHRHPIILTWDWSLQNVHQITFYAPLTIICINLKMHLAFCRLAFHPSNTSLLPPKVNLLIFFPKQRNLKSPGSWCSMNSKEFANTTNTNSNVYIVCHSFKHSGPSLVTTEGQSHKKRYVFKLMQISIDRALNKLVVISGMQDHFFSWPVSERVS